MCLCLLILLQYICLKYTMITQCYIQVHVTIVSFILFSTVPLGKIDSSGLNLYYSFTPTKIKAGNFAIGATSVPHMIIPPNAETFTHESLCSSMCLDRVCTLIIELIQYNVIISYIFSSIFLRMVFIFLPLFCIHI